MPQGSPALHPGLWSIGPFAGAALPAVAGAQPGMPPCSSASSVPAAALAPSSFDAALAAAALAPGSMFASLSAATAGNSFPDWQAGAPVLGSGWAPAPAGELPVSGRLDAGALAGWPSGVMLQCAAQPAGGSGAPGPHPHCPAASCPAFPDPQSAAAGHQPASPAADVQPVGGPPAMGQQSALLASTQALEQLLDLSSTPAWNNVFAPLQSQGGQRWRLGGEGQRCGWRAGRGGKMLKRITACSAAVSTPAEALPFPTLLVCRANAGVPALVDCRWRAALAECWYLTRVTRAKEERAWSRCCYLNG